MITTFKKYLDSINEGLIKTYPISQTSRSIKKEFIKYDIKVISYNNNTFKLELLNLNTYSLEELDILINKIDIHIVNKCGWFPGKMDINTGSMRREYKYNVGNIYKFHELIKSLIITFESKYGESDDIPIELFHLSIMEYKRKITRHGLIPKSESKRSYHIDRIYLCKSIQDCEKLIPQMDLHHNTNHINDKSNKDLTPIIFKVDNSSKYINNLYIDPDFDGGYYTIDNIPPNLINPI